MNVTLTIITKDSELIRQDYIKRIYHRKNTLHVILTTDEHITISDKLIREYSIDTDAKP